MEEQESVLDALHRGVREETGLEVHRAGLLGVFSDPTRIIEYPGGATHRTMTVAFIVVPQPGAAPRPSNKSLELRLFARDELAVLPLWPAATPIRDAYLAFDGTPVVA